MPPISMGVALGDKFWERPSVYPPSQHRCEPACALNILLNGPETGGTLLGDKSVDRPSVTPSCILGLCMNHLYMEALLGDKFCRTSVSVSPYILLGDPPSIPLHHHNTRCKWVGVCFVCCFLAFCESVAGGVVLLLRHRLTCPHFAS